MKIKNDQSLKEVLKELVDSYRLKPKLVLAKIKDKWPGLMGPLIQKYTRELRLDKQTLIITVDSASLRQELSMGRDRIKKLVNEELDEPYIQDVIVR